MGYVWFSWFRWRAFAVGGYEYGTCVGVMFMCMVHVYFRVCSWVCMVHVYVYATCVVWGVFRGLWENMCRVHTYVVCVWYMCSLGDIVGVLRVVIWVVHVYVVCVRYMCSLGDIRGLNWGVVGGFWMIHVFVVCVWYMCSLG